VVQGVAHRLSAADMLMMDKFEGAGQVTVTPHNSFTSLPRSMHAVVPLLGFFSTRRAV
jgi:hypothetical protein